MNSIDPKVVFPITMTWEDGSTQVLPNLASLECDLEDFDSAREPTCKIVDAEGFDVTVHVSLTWIQHVSRAGKTS